MNPSCISCYYHYYYIALVFTSFVYTKISILITSTVNLKFVLMVFTLVRCYVGYDFIVTDFMFIVVMPNGISSTNTTDVLGMEKEVGRCALAWQRSENSGIILRGSLISCGGYTNNFAVCD